MLATVVLLVLPGVSASWSDPSSLDTTPLDLALVDASAWVVVACASWAWLAVTVTVSEAWRGSGRAPGRLWHLPPGVRRLVLAACGVALASAVSAPAHAADGTDHGQTQGVGLLSGLPLPDRAVAPHQAGSPRPPHPWPRTVTVRPGDTLWSIAARVLPDGASDRAVAARWHAIYAANRPRIGRDPDVIEPGQHLHLPRKDRP
jgi:hypothetical protein